MGDGGNDGASIAEGDLDDAITGTAEDALDELLADALGEQGGARVSVRDGTSSGRPSSSRRGEDAIALSLDLSLDANPADIESLVRGIRRGLTAERGDAER